MAATPLWDTHCHLDVDRMHGTRDAAVARAREAGVTDLVVPGIEPAGVAHARAMAASITAVRVHLAWGLHPQWLPGAPEEGDAAAFAAVEAACAAQRPVAVGECGLDFRVVDLVAAPRERQERVLRWHLRLARRLELPVLLHALSAHNALLRVLDEEGPLPAGGVMHSYSGSAEMVREFVGRGLHISFAGPVGWKGARKAPLAAAACPAERLLVETDSPDQSPEPVRDQQNEPAHLVHVIRAVAQARGSTFDDVAALTTANARALFHRP